MADGDLISRASLLAGIAELKESPWYNYGKYEGDFDDLTVSSMIDMIKYSERKEAIAVIIEQCIEKETAVEAEPDNGWINVKDRLPDGDGNLYDGLEESKYVLVYGCCENGYGYGIGTYIRDHIDHVDGWNGCLSGLYDLDSCDVTHWMPLPEPPKEDKNDN